MNTNKRVGPPVPRSMVVLAAFAAVLVVSCSSPEGPLPSDLTDSDLLEFQSHYMNSYNANTSTPVTAGARTTITVGSPLAAISGAPYPTGTAFAGLVGVVGGTTLANYPDAGLSTTFTVVPQTRSDVYKITAVTTFPASDLRSTYTEAYFVQDITPGDAPAGTLWASHPDGSWTNDDPVVTPSGADWVQNQAARETLSLVFKNGDTRQEAVYDVTTRYALPAMGDSFLLKDTSKPALDATAPYSSVVAYVTRTTSLTSRPYWTATTTPPSVIGLRYYSEKGGTWGSVSFERIVAEDVSLTGKTLADLEGFILRNGLALGSSVYTPLGTSVLRESPTAKVMVTNLYNNVKGLTYKLSLDSTGQIILVSTTSGQLIQSGL